MFESLGVPTVVDGVAFDIIMIFVCLAMMVTQFFFCWKWRNAFIKLIPTFTAIVVCFIFFLLMWNGGTNTLEGFLLWLGWLCVGLIVLAADAFGWLVFAIFSLVQEIRQKGLPNPAGY